MKSGASANIIFTLRGLRPLIVRCIIMGITQTTHEPAKDKSYLRPARVVNTGTLYAIAANLKNWR